MTFVMALFAAVLMLGMPTMPVAQNGIDPVENASAAAGDRTVRIGISSLMDSVETLNPFTYTWGNELFVIWQCYSTLMQFDVNQNVVGDLAINWTTSPDGKVWHIKIAKNAVFYNKNLPVGSPQVPVTSADVAFSYWLAQNSSAGLQTYFPQLPGQPGRLISNIETPTPYDIIITIRAAYAPFFAAYCFVPILPKYIWQNETYTWANFRTKSPGALWPPIVGSGPFYYGLNGLPEAGVVELLKSPTWFQNEERGYDIHVDKIILRSETEDSNYVDYVTNKINDIFIAPTVEQWINGSIPGTKFTSSQGYVWEFNMNQMSDAMRATLPSYKNGENNQLLLDPAVKRALQMCVDKQYIATSIFKDTAKPSDSLVPQSHPFHYVYGSDPGDVPILFDPASARGLLYAAGWNYRADGSEILTGALDYNTYFPLYQSVGGIATNKLQFGLITPNTDTLYDPTCREIELRASQAGIDLVYGGPSTSSYMNNAWYTADYDTWLWNWWMGPTYDVSTEIMQYLATEAIGAWSDVYYSNATFDALYYASLSELDPVKRKVITDELQRIGYEDSGCWPVIWIDNLYAAQSVAPDFWTNWGDWNTKYPLCPDGNPFYWLWSQIYPTDNPAPSVSGVASRFPSDTLTPVSFSATVVDNSLYSDLEYQWNFGDGNKSGWLTPAGFGQFGTSWTYAKDGYYDVYFMVREKTGLDTFGSWAKSMAVISDLSNTAPKNLAFTSWPTDPDSGTIVYLNGTATDDQGDPLTYAWTFGDGTLGTGQQTTHQFTIGDPSYTVTMLVDDGHLGTGSRPVPKSNLVTVGTNHMPSNSARDEPSVEKGQAWTFRTTVSDIDSRDRLRLTWDWGDGTKTVQNIATAVLTPTPFETTHVYTFNDDYLLTVYADDKTGLSGHNVTDVALVHVQRIGNAVPYLNDPITDFWVSNAAPNTETMVTFSATVLDGNGDICDVNFTFGDGAYEVKRQTTANSTVSVTHTYVTGGAYLAYLDATDGQDSMSPTPDPLFIDVAQAEYVLNLVTGWNFVSVPRIGWGYMASSLGLVTNDIVSGFNPTTQTYDKNYVIGVSLPFKDFAIAPNTGYWIMAAAPRTLHLYGAVPTEEQYREITVPGPGSWAIVGFNMLRTDMKASDVVANYTGGSITQVVMYTPGVGYKTFNPLLPFINNFYIAPAQAYWVLVTASGTLSYTP